MSRKYRQFVARLLLAAFVFAHEVFHCAQFATWAEHTLYYIFLESQGLFDRYHAPIAARCLYCGDVSAPGELDGWPGRILTDKELGPYFTTVQSWLQIPPDEVWRRVRPVLVENGAPAGLPARL